MSLEITINGSALVVDEADPHLSLLSFLRELGLTGAKEGCGEGECGACAVVMIRPSLDPSSGRQSRYVAVNSCLIPLPSMHGHEIITVEGLASEAGLHPVQEVMIQEGASQCGYCTPGFVMSLFAARYEDPEGTLDPGALAGNLCRCTGYRSILDAARALPLPAADDPFLRRLEEPAPEPGALEYEAEGARFLRPTRLAELLEQLAVHPEATLLAGGSDRMVEITQHAARFSTLISVEGVDELRIFEFSEEGIEIGAALSLSEVEAKLASRLPILDELFRLFASPLVRNRATLGGNVGNASPIGDAPPILLSLEAELRLASARGTRRLPISEFFRGYRETALEPGEVIVSILLPSAVPTLSRFYKVSKRVLDDISTVAAAFALHLDTEGRIERARLAYGGVAATPKRAMEAEAALIGLPWGVEAVDAARPLLEAAFQPLDDHRGSAAYRKEMVVRLFEKFESETREGGR